MKAFKILLVFGMTVFAALFAAGLFGIAHDQISYTVSEEYFTKFKFVQFNLVEAEVGPRFKAGVVGFLASWWMGIPIGLVAGWAGFQHAGARRRLKICLLSLVVAMGFTLAFGLCGLGYGYLRTQHFQLAEYSHWYIPKGLAHPRRFLCAGYMHNASYMGGVLSMPVVWWFHRARRLRNAGASGQHTP